MEKKAYYEELLKDPKWKEKREHIIKRDGHKCLKCGATKNLQVHHLYYETLLTNDMPVSPWNYPDSAMITLCETCHLEVHRNLDIEIRYKNEFKGPLAPGAWINENGKVVAPPLVKKEDFFHFLSEHETVTYEDLKCFFAEHKIDYGQKID